MNTQTVVLIVLVFWLIMGLAFLSSMSEVLRKGGNYSDALKTNEAFFFIVSLICGVVAMALKIFR